MKAGRLLSGVAIAGALIGFRFYNRSQTEAEVRAQLIEICEDDASCAQAVETHYEGCFEESYSLGSRRRSGSMDATTLVSCLNTRSGEEHFEIEEPESSS